MDIAFSGLSHLGSQVTHYPDILQWVQTRRRFSERLLHPKVSIHTSGHRAF